MAVEVDPVFRALGRPGSYHIFIYILLCCNYFPVILNHLAMAIYGAKTPHACAVPPDYSLNSSVSVITVQEDPGKCFVYKNFSKETNLTTPCPLGWVYKAFPREKNIVMEWDLVCDRSYLVRLATTIYFVGVMVGGLIFGSLSDYFGRKPFMLFCLYAHVIVGAGLFFAESYTVFILLRFFLGMLMQGLQTCTIVLIMEYFTPEHRTAAGTVFEVFWGVGVLWLAGVSYAIQDWRYIQLAITLPSIITISYIWLVPESLRWLVARKKYEAAEDILKKAAKFNKVVLAEDPLGVKQEKVSEVRITEVNGSKEVKHYNLLDMFKTPQLRKRSLVLFYVWLTTATGYYGLTYSITTLAGNKYLNLFIGGLVELPAYCVAVYILKRYGRRKPLCVYMFIGGIFCIAAGFIPRKEMNGINLGLVSTALAMLGRMGMAGCFSVVLLYTCELYPTVIRNIGLGACAFWARIGGVLYPQILGLDKFFQALPVLVLGTMALMGGFLALLLPETVHHKLPETVCQAEQIQGHSDGSNRGDIPQGSTSELDDLIQNGPKQKETFI